MELMDLGIFFTILCVCTYLATWLVKKGTEIIFPQWQDESNKWEKLYKEVFLPIFPAIVGGLICLINTLPYPEMIGDSKAAHVLFGLFCGFCSSYVVRIVKGQLKSKLPVKVEQKVDEVVPDQQDPNSLK